MKRPNRKRFVNRAGIVTVNYTKALEKYIDFLEAENKQLAISSVVVPKGTFYCRDKNDANNKECDKQCKLCKHVEIKSQ